MRVVRILPFSSDAKAKGQQRLRMRKGDWMDGRRVDLDFDMKVSLHRPMLWRCDRRKPEYGKMPVQFAIHEMKRKRATEGACKYEVQEQVRIQVQADRRPLTQTQGQEQEQEQEQNVYNSVCRADVSPFTRRTRQNKALGLLDVPRTTAPCRKDLHQDSISRSRRNEQRCCCCGCWPPSFQVQV